MKSEEYKGTSVSMAEEQDAREREAREQEARNQIIKEQLIRKKKRRRKKNYLLRIFLFILFCIAVGFFTKLEIFDVSKIEVEGNSFYTDEQIAEKAEVATGKNIFYDLHKRDIKKTLLQDPYIRDAKISRRLPHTVRIIVDERKEAAAVKYGESYIILDEDGLVLRQTEVEPMLTLLEGLTLRTIEPGKALEVEENYVLSDTLEILKMMNESDIFFKKIDLTGVMLKAYIYDTLICNGTPEAIEENLKNGGLQQVLYELYSQGVERGTITVNSDGSCAFSAAIE